MRKTELTSDSPQAVLTEFELLNVHLAFDRIFTFLSLMRNRDLHNELSEHPEIVPYFTAFAQHIFEKAILLKSAFGLSESNQQFDELNRLILLFNREIEIVHQEGEQFVRLLLAKTAKTRALGQFADAELQQFLTLNPTST